MLTSSSWATSESDFTAGISAFRKNELAAAAEHFQKAALADPRSPTALHNLALVQWKLGHPGLALGLWRRATSVNSGYAPAETGIAWVKNKLDHTEIAHEVEYWESFRSSVLNQVSLGAWVILTAAFLLLSGWQLLGFFGARRRAVLDEAPGPAFPALGVLLGFLFAAFAAASIAEVYDTTVARGTIVAKRVEAHSSPDFASTALFELFEGLEVIVDQANQGWLQVTYPGGATGWIPADALLRTSADTPLVMPTLAATSEKPASPASAPTAANPSTLTEPTVLDGTSSMPSASPSPISNTNAVDGKKAGS